MAGRASGAARVVFLATSLRCQASRVAGVTGKIPVHRRRGMNRVSAANQARSAGSVPHPACVTAQHCILMPERQQLSIPRLVSAEHQDNQANSQRISR